MQKSAKIVIECRLYVNGGVDQASIKYQWKLWMLLVHMISKVQHTDHWATTLSAMTFLTAKISQRNLRQYNWQSRITMLMIDSQFLGPHQMKQKW